MKTKIHRYNFAFSERTDKLLKLLKEKTELSYTVLIKEGLELLAEKKGFKDEEE